MSLVENAGSIVISLVLQIIIFGDIPNTVKILGAILTVTSIVIIGIQKIFKARAMSAPSATLRQRLKKHEQKLQDKSAHSCQPRMKKQRSEEGI